MAETNRVQRWREGKRQEGLKAVTVWLTTEEELRLKDLALQRQCSPLRPDAASPGAVRLPYTA